MAPAAHFGCGGVRADLTGRTSVAGLFAIGEVADTGVHGANRLASNGVTEGLVAGRRVGAALGAVLPLPQEPVIADTARAFVSAMGRRERAAAMSRWAGPLREPIGLAELASALAAGPIVGEPFDLAQLEATNLHTVSWLIVQGATIRQESRGCHRRLDAPDPSPAWQGRIEQRLDGDLVAAFVPDEVAA